MTLSRPQLRHQAVISQYRAGHTKPPTRKQVQAWLSPIRKALSEIKTGEVDAVRDDEDERIYPITRLHSHDEDYARIDHAINGFAALIIRLMPDFDMTPMDRLANKLANGVLLEVAEIDTCFALLNDAENRLMT